MIIVMIVNWQIFISTFLMIFLAELGDKTQLAIFAFASKEKSSLSVFLGASFALVLTSLTAVLLGGVLGKVMPERVMKVAAGLIFIGFGLWSIMEAVKG